jgi:hypothetical protein
LPGASERPWRFSISATNAAEPSGRPISSLRRSRPKASCGLALEKADKGRRAVEERPHADQPVVAPGEMGARGRMRFAVHELECAEDSLAATLRKIAPARAAKPAA